MKEELKLKLTEPLTLQNLKSLEELVEETAIGFYRWMNKEDTVHNSEKYFFYTDEDMFQEYLKIKDERI